MMQLTNALLVAAVATKQSSLPLPAAAVVKRPVYITPLAPDYLFTLSPSEQQRYRDATAAVSSERVHAPAATAGQYVTPMPSSTLHHSRLSGSSNVSSPGLAEQAAASQRQEQRLSQGREGAEVQQGRTADTMQRDQSGSASDTQRGPEHAKKQAKKRAKKQRNAAAAASR